MEHVHQYNEAVTKLKLLLDQSNFEQSEPKDLSLSRQASLRSKGSAFLYP